MFRLRGRFLCDEESALRLAVAPMLVCLSMLCAFEAKAQETSAPFAPQAQTQPPKPARSASPRTTTTIQTPRAPRVAPVAPAAPQAPLPPQQVVTIVHRLSGWKLLAWRAASGPPGVELDELPSLADAHTNIVAGYVSDDGRTIIARLPQAEAELESLPVPSLPQGFFQASGGLQNADAEFTLVLSNDKRVGAKFVGLDSATGLSLLEASEPVLSGAAIGVQGDTEDPTVGQRVRLYAPAPAPKPAAKAGVGYIYLSIDQMEGRLTEVRRGPSGKAVRVVARTNATPEWTGAIAANELGEVVGIVSHSDSGETQIVPVATMLAARERVLKLRGSAPQPWLGIRGDASFQLKLDEWVRLGWKPELALPHIKNARGVFLTAVVPGTPAALAGFRPGDVIASVGQRDVRSVEDLSFTLSEAGVGSILDFTVWRAFEPLPLKFSVMLKGARNPALATAIAEERAALAAATGQGRTPPASLQSLGLHTIGLTPRIASRLSAKGGILVVAVRPESSADACGLRAGDVIETANGAALTHRELNRLLFTTQAQPVSLGILREGRRLTLSLPFKAGVVP